jgi:DNA primase
MSNPVDFAEIRERVSLEQAVQFLGLDLKRDGAAYRGPCPHCASGGDRALIVTPAKGFYCHAQKRGGNDSTSLVAHVKGLSQRDAAAELQEHFLTVPKATPSGTKKTASGFDPDAFAQKLVYSGEVEDMGISEDEAHALSIGFHPQRELVYFPVRNADASIAGFIAITDAAAIKLPPTWLLSTVVPFKARA